MIDISDDVVLIDKPAGWTSFDVVAKLRGHLRAQTGQRKVKVGHGGTLDPFATGLLVVLVGAACKRADQLLKLDKTYEFTAVLGKTSTTGDPEGEITESSRQSTADSSESLPRHSGLRAGIQSKNSSNVRSQSAPTLEEVEQVLGRFTGGISQTPPAYSAIKVNGTRAYDLARAGKEVKLEPRPVTIHALTLDSYAWPELKLIAHVSSGTYIRTLAEDIGAALGTGAYCSQLRRTQVGDYSLGTAQTVDQIVGSTN